jgi:hypothetical protein
MTAERSQIATPTSISRIFAIALRESLHAPSNRRWKASLFQDAVCEAKKGRPEDRAV